MLVYAGIDEAGYGPMLGPLCVGVAAFVLTDYDPAAGPPDLWKLLSRAVCRKPADRRRRIAVHDSKLLKAPNSGKQHPLRHLERGVLSVLVAASERTDANEEGKDDVAFVDDVLYERLGCHPGDEPWARGRVVLPLAQSADQLRIAASRLRKATVDAGISIAHLGCDAVHVPRFNQLADRMGGKAGVNLCAAARLVDDIWRRWPTDHPRIMIDRHGGRTHYRRELALLFPDARIDIIAETDRLSRYRLVRNGSPLTISFQVDGDHDHLPVALASMVAKYTRELFMIRLNRYFRQLMPELKPTAGYVQDARRYLKELEPVLKRERINQRALVRVC